MSDNDEAGAISTTLDKGLRCLMTLADAPEGLLVTEIAEKVGVHRTVANRLLRTLELRGLVRRDRHRRYFPGGGLVALAESVDRDLRKIARPVLEDLAVQAQATAYLMMAEPPDRVRALDVVEPRNSPFHVAFKAGQVHPITVGSGGIAILAGRGAGPSDSDAVVRARELGYALTHGEVVPALTGIASPVVTAPRQADLSVGVSLLQEEDHDKIGSIVAEAAGRLSAALVAADATRW